VELARLESFLQQPYATLSGGQMRRMALAEELIGDPAFLSPIAYVVMKFLHLILLSAIQAFWMTWFVKTMCGFPGTLLGQFGILFATTLARSTVCLAISAGSPTPERASLLAIYLVVFSFLFPGRRLLCPIGFQPSVAPSSPPIGAGADISRTSNRPAITTLSNNRPIRSSRLMKRAWPYWLFISARASSWPGDL
jgi:hypothetical protein